MTMKKKQLALLVGQAVGLMALVGVGQVAMAQEKVERVEVTGTSIKRIATEGALPVTTIGKEEIAKTGATTVSELMQALPAMQGFTTSSASVGGGGGGIMTASLHDIGESYTLVLLNGRRMAPRGSGSTIDLNSIPLSAVERVEVLTDGASALYGSDAIAGVVNFILKQNQQGFQGTARYDMPQHKGGQSWTGSMSYGFGDLDKNGYNVLLAYSHDHKDVLKATDRDFAKSGILSFKSGGQDLYFFNGSGNAIPGNAQVIYTNAAGETKTRTFNPYLMANGKCAAQNSRIGNNCYFDYTSTIEIQPESDRDSFFGRAVVKLGGDWQASFDGVYSEYKMTTRIAPYPTGYFPLPLNSALVNTYVKPYLTAEQLSGLTGVNARWRTLPAGNRTTEWDTVATHFVAAVEGPLLGWDVNAAVTYGVNDTKQNYPTGWILADPFLSAVSSGAIDVFGTSSGLGSAGQTTLMNTLYHGPWDKEKTSMTAVEARASRSLFKLGGGDAQFGIGGDFRKYKYSRWVAPANANEQILFLSKDDPYGLKRDNLGVFAELVAPLTKELELTGSVRYDEIGKVTDTTSGASYGKDQSDVTYKLSGRFQPNKDVLFRGSVGTGFKAPTMLEIGRPRSEFGVTADNYSCPFKTAGDPLRATCVGNPDEDKNQYTIFLQGNRDLKPEKSKQYSLGVVLQPTNNISASADWWMVKMKDVVTQLSEAQIFANPVLYRNLFTTKRNLATGKDELAILQAAVNAAKGLYQGIDWKLTYDEKFSFGTWKNTLAGTVMLQSKYTRPGTEEWVSSVAQYGENNTVTFKNIFQLTSSLKTGAFTHTAVAHYRSGYKDQFKSADDCAVTTVDALGDCVDIQLNIPSYTTYDWQTSYQINKMFEVRGGITNLFDRKPHLSLQTGAGSHQVGYDPRYNDSYGRTFYLQADVKF